MRISDWSSDVCSSDLLAQVAAGKAAVHLADDVGRRDGGDARARAQPAAGGDRQLPQRFAAPGRPGRRPGPGRTRAARSEEHTSELQSLMRISYAVFCLKHTQHTLFTSTHIHTQTKTIAP